MPDYKLIFGMNQPATGTLLTGRGGSIIMLLWRVKKMGRF
jgi:hypothetical protein